MNSGSSTRVESALKDIDWEALKGIEEGEKTTDTEKLGLGDAVFDPTKTIDSASGTGDAGASIEQLADINAIRDLSDLSEQQMAELGPLLEAENERRKAAEGAAGELATQGQELAAGKLTPEQLQRLDEIATRNIEVGSSDINAQLQRSLETLREESGASRGLRFTDTPIFNVAQDVTTDANRQVSQLIAQTRGAQAANELNLPMQMSNINFQQQTLQNQLAQQAFNNRLLLTGETTGLGLGIADRTISPAQYQLGLKGINAQVDAANAAKPSTTDKLLGAGIAIGSAALISDENVKHDVSEVDTSDILQKFKELRIHTWRYNEDQGLGTEKHIGPMAQEFQRVFGVGDGKTINTVDIMGVLLAAQKAMVEEHLNG